MASVEDLKKVLKETLDNRGVLGQIRARIRAEVFSALDDQTDTRPALSNENMLINELIREYLEFNNYKYSSSVLVAESGQPQDPLDRGFVKKELNITEDHGTATVPLLYGIVSHFMQQEHLQSSSKPFRPGPGARVTGGADIRHMDRRSPLLKVKDARKNTFDESSTPDDSSLLDEKKLLIHGRGTRK